MEICKICKRRLGLLVYNYVQLGLVIYDYIQLASFYIFFKHDDELIGSKHVIILQKENLLFL